MKLHKLLLVITLAILALESIADTPSGTDYVTFWSGDMRIYSQQPNTEVTLIDIDTGLTLNMLADPRISWANINGTSSNSNPFTLSTAGDQWRGRGGIGAPTQEIRVRILSDAPVTVWTGSNLSGSNAWGSMIPSSVSSTASFGSEVGRSFTGFVDKEMVIVAPVGSGSSPTEIAINNLTLGSSETLILNASVPNCPPYPCTCTRPLLYGEQQRGSGDLR